MFSLDGRHPEPIEKMKLYYSFCLYSLFVLFSCKAPPADPEVELELFPSELSKIFEHHGGLETWKQMNSLSYEIVKEGGNEKQEIDLRTRNERIEGSDFLTGFDGKKIWLRADTTYKGNAEFYHNLIFYFYAMPFVVADEGIIYSDTKPLVYDNVTYPGIRISYQPGIGFSPEDEYFVHYDPTNYQMAWLGYTVTYFTGAKSKSIHWIRYEDWGKINGLMLPLRYSRYNYDNGLPTGFRNKVVFDKISINEKEFPQSLFHKPEGAEYLESD